MNLCKAYWEGSSNTIDIGCTGHIFAASVRKGDNNYCTPCANKVMGSELIAVSSLY